MGAGRRVHEGRRYRAPRAGPNTFLPNGWEVSYVSKPDVPFLYHEVLPAPAPPTTQGTAAEWLRLCVFDGHILCVQIFIEEVYTRHGVTLDPDSVVVDIGANIGLVRSRKQHRFWVLPWR